MNPYEKMFEKKSRPTPHIGPPKLSGLFDVNYVTKPRPVRFFGLIALASIIVYFMRQEIFKDPVSLFLLEQKEEEERRLLERQKSPVQVPMSFDL